MIQCVFMSFPFVKFVVDESGKIYTETTFAAITNASSGAQAFFDGGYVGIFGMAMR